MKIILHIFLFSFFSLLNINPEESYAGSNPPACAGENGVLRMFYYNEIYGYSVADLENHPRYPLSPSGVTFLDEFNLDRFNIYYGFIVRGYLKAPETGEYSFQTEGDNESKFQLSTDDNPDNLINGLEISGTSGAPMGGTVNLVEGDYYYFEYKHKNHGGYNYNRVEWKLPSNINGDWEFLDVDATYDYTCETICNLPGTPCDDGDPNTINDQEDGRCGCFGRIATSNTCIGEPGAATVLYYENIEGIKIADMETDASFPTSPTSTEQLTYFEGPNSGVFVRYGTWIKAFIYAPVTGEYTFNIISDNEGQAWLSSGESSDPADLSVICHAPNSSGVDNHDAYASQTSPPMTLQAGQYYYFEFKHKENAGSDYYKMFWKTPFLDDGEWHIIRGTYLHRYNCETDACMPMGIPCNDNNNNTFNDQYDENCNCIGEPCITPDCVGDETYIAYEACDVTDQHTNQLDAWQSCETTANPNPARGNKHWILYDLATLYQIHDTHIWNYNMAGETNKGIQNVVIDISMDGTTWTELGTYTWPQAPGTTAYEGFAGDDYGGAIAQYILITALDTWGDGTCAGFSELKVTLETCPEANTPCDDGDPMTENDAYDESCNCAGSPVTLATDLLAFGAKWDDKNVLIEWTVENEEEGILYEVQRSLDAQHFEAIGVVSAKGINGQKTGYQMVDIRAHQLANELFYRLRMIESSSQERFSHLVNLRQADGLARLKIDALSPNPFKDMIQIGFTVPKDNTSLELLVFNGRGQLIRRLTRGAYSQGHHLIQWDGRDNGGSSVESGIYYLQLTDGRQRIGRRMVKL